MGYRQSVLADLPWGYWRLGELSGTTAYDASGKGLNGTYQGGVALGQVGALVGDGDAATSFNGLDGRVAIDPIFAPRTNSYSMEAWFKTSDPISSGQRVIFGSNWAASTSYQIRLVNSGGIRFESLNLLNGTGSVIWKYGSYNDGNWHHVVAVIDVNASQSLLYIDGVLVASGAHTIVDLNPTIGSSIGAIRGWDANSYSLFWNGLIDEVAIYNYALSADQISRHYQEALAPTTAISLFTPSFQSGAEYRLDLHTAAGVKVAEVTDFLGLAYTRKVNDAGLLTFTLDGNHAAIPLLEDKSQVVVYRRNRAMGLDWTADFVGLWRGQERRYTDHDVFEAHCQDILAMLSWRVVAWYAGTTNRSDFQNVKAETVMKTLVSYNAGPNATTANGRVRNGTITGLTVETDQARGNTISYSCAWKSLLAALQDIAGIGGGDFDLIKTGAQTFEFRFYPGQRGTDRRSTLLFALDRGNMVEPVYTYDRTKEQTVAIIGGQGEGSDRQVVVRTGADYAATNDIEVFVDARNESTTAGLQAKGDAKLYDTRARPAFTFNVLQTLASYYGVHYGLGDLVRASYLGIETTQKIVGVSVSLDRDGAEKIDVETMLV